MLDEDVSSIIAYLRSKYNLKNIRAISRKEFTVNLHFQCSINGKEYLLKMYFVHDGNVDYVKRKAEIESEFYLSQGKTFNLPKVIEYGSMPPFILMEKKESSRLSKFTIDHLRLKEIMNILRAFHKLKPFSKKVISTNFTPSMCIGYAFDLYEKRIISRKEVKFIESIFSENKGLLSDVKKTIVHGDATLNNFSIVNGKIQIWDFERVRIDIPLYDLATLYIDLNHISEKTFLRGYQKHLSDKDLKLFRMMLIRRILECLRSYIYRRCFGKKDRQNTRAQMQRDLRLLNRLRKNWRN
jgi:thiamine kinase-like enzyme